MTVDISQHPFHPLANEYPLLSEEALDAMAEDIKANGQLIRITMLDGLVLDGRNRYLACLRAGLDPQVRQYDGPEDEASVRAFVESLNEHRRMLDAPTLSRLRQARVERVRAARAEGKVLREIAAEEGVSTAQVRRDLGEPAAARPPARKAKGENPPAEEAAAAAGPGLDDWGVPVQPHAAEAFAARPKFDELLAALRQARRLFSELAESPGGAFLTLPAVSACVRKGGESSFVSHALERAIEDVRAARPAHTDCPWAHSEGGHPEECRTCGNRRWTPPLSASAVPEKLLEKIRGAYGV